MECKVQHFSNCIGHTMQWTENIINEINNALNTKIASYKEIELWDGNTSERIFKDFNGK